MPTRLLILGLLVLAVAVAVLLVRRWNARRSRALATTGTPMWAALACLAGATLLMLARNQTPDRQAAPHGHTVGEVR